MKALIITAIVAIIIAVSINTDKIKENLSWVFEVEQEAAALPDLSNKEIEETVTQNRKKERGATPVKNKNTVMPKNNIENNNDTTTP